MKKLILIVTCYLFVNTESFCQFDIRGVWVVCDTTESCEAESSPMYMLISDSTMAIVFSLATGLDPEYFGLMYYTIENGIMETIDTNSTGKVFINHFNLVWVNGNRLYLIDQKGELNIYLFRQEE
jgi:hypothetical protein